MKQRYDAIEAIRGLAALTVLLGHFCQMATGFQPFRVSMAVNMFFLMSGVVIARSYEERLRQGMTFGQFATVRMIRLYPLMALGGILGLAATAITGKPEGDLAHMLFHQLTFIPSFWHKDLFPLNSVQWSLFFELAINFVYALFLPRLTNRKLAVIVFLSMIYLVCDYQLTGLNFATLGWGTGWNFVGGFPLVAFYFFGGVLFYRWSLTREAPRVSVMVPIAIFAASMANVPVPNFPENPIVGIVALPVATWLCLNTYQSASRVAAWLGRLSFPLYALHVPPMLVAHHYWGNVMTASDLIGWFVVIASILIAAIAADRWFDEPVRAWLTKSHRMTQPARLSG